MKSLDLVLAVAILLALAGLVAYLREEPREFSGTVRIVDGDTLAFPAGRVRLIGIDAPELAQTCGPANGVYPCGLDAKAALERLASHAAILCRSTSRDRFGRALARCEVAGNDLGAAMVREGWAVAYGGYTAEELQARLARRGLWAAPFEQPSDWRRAHPR